MKKLTRLESSKECRRVLNRHGVNLSECQYMCSGYEVRLHGKLMKVDGTNFHAHQIEAMIADFQKVLRGVMVYGELENWTFSSDNISYLGDKQKEATGTAEDKQERYELNLDDFDFEAS